MPERFPPPYAVDDTGTSWRVSDAAGFAIVWFCYEPRDRADTAAERLTREQAYAFATNFARLPELLKAAGRARLTGAPP